MPADASTADQLARGGLPLGAIVGRFIVAPVIGVFIALGFSLKDDGGDVMVSIITAVVVVTILTAALITSTLLRLRRRMRRLVPVGTPLSAEFTPLWIGHRLGGDYAQLSLGSLTRVRVNDRVVMLSRGRRPVVLLPREMVPQVVVDDYLARFRRH